MPGYEFTEHARRDLDSIVDYTLNRWDQAQALRYIDGLENQAERLARNPEMGRVCQELREGLFSFPYVSHVIYYAKSADGITKEFFMRAWMRNFISPQMNSIV